MSRQLLGPCGAAVGRQAVRRNKRGFRWPGISILGPGVADIHPLTASETNVARGALGALSIDCLR
ncbi:MAG: hypothetical protein HYX78_00265 [Armatimonadetes bacterium]|nr:hypothetical protein [Armatimonadota bacterium]